jgi:TonB family protein
VVPGAFGSPEGSAVVAQAKAVKGVDFSEPAMAKAQPTAVKVAALAPVAILSKPAPIYTEEARRLHVEGSVTLNVVFAASGEVHIVGVVKGLGHGLDEAATAAARQIRFTPARREGQSVDYPATIHIVFALS